MQTINFEATVKAQTARFLASDALRTYTTERGNYVAHFEEEHDVYDDGTPYHILRQTDWGACYSEIRIPQNYGELVNLKVRAQLGGGTCDLPQIAYRYYYEIMKQFNN